LLAALRIGEPPIVARAQRGAVVFDCRTLSEEDLEAIPPALAQALEELPPSLPDQSPLAPSAD
jgi:rhodanese-related sulfurtransferase